MGLICLPGRATYSNLSRYSELNEKTYRLWFGKKLDFIEFNRLGIHEIMPATHAKIAALDASFMEKSGEKTYGLGKFYNSKQGKLHSHFNACFCTEPHQVAGQAFISLSKTHPVEPF